MNSFSLDSKSSDLGRRAWSLRLRFLSMFRKETFFFERVGGLELPCPQRFAAFPMDRKERTKRGHCTKTTEVRRGS